jgi:mannose-1-phosphate guanylyltransferase
LPLVDRPILDHVLDHLVAYGVHEVIMSSPYLETTFHPFIEARAGDPAVTWVTERDPLGTGGAIVNVLDRLGDEPFVALNGDILTDLDLTEMLTSHRSTEAVATIALHRVGDVRAFGLIATDRGGRITAFREKPPDPVPGDINAGTYILDPAVLRAWPAGTNVSVEREIFPGLIEGGASVRGFSSDAYWLDLGTPAQYLRAHFDLLEGKVEGVSYDAPWIGRGADVDVRAHLGRWVVVGASATVGAGAQVEDSVLLPAAAVGADVRIVGSILGRGVIVSGGATLVDCVLGDGARVPEGVSVEGWRASAGAIAGSS